MGRYKKKIFSVKIKEKLITKSINPLLVMLGKAIKYDINYNEEKIDEKTYISRCIFAFIDEEVLKYSKDKIEKNFTKLATQQKQQLAWMVSRWILLSQMSLQEDVVLKMSLLSKQTKEIQALRSFILTYRPMKVFKKQYQKSKNGGPKIIYVEHSLFPLIIDLIEIEYKKNFVSKFYEIFYDDPFIYACGLRKIEKESFIRRVNNIRQEHAKDNKVSTFFLTFIRFVNFLSEEDFELIFNLMNFVEAANELKGKKINENWKFSRVDIFRMKSLADSFWENPTILNEVALNSYLTDSIRSFFT